MTPSRTHRDRRNRLASPVALFLVALASLAGFLFGPVGAQEAERTVYEVSAGPHAVKVVPVNTNLAAGSVQIAVFVRNAATNEIVPDAKVALVVKNEEENYEGWATALNSPADPERYDARMILDSTGLWEVGVHVSSPLGQGGATFTTFEVPTVQRYTSGSLVFFGVFGVIFLGVAYVWWSTRRANRRKAAQS